MKNDKRIAITLPSMDTQRLMILEMETEKAITTLKSNLLEKKFPKADGVNYAELDERIFLTQDQGWVAPPSDLVDAWFNQVKELFDEYRSDRKLGNLLGLQGDSADRRIRAYRKGSEVIPYGIWRNFLEVTGRVTPEIKPVLGIFDMEQNDE
ncbi:hypothetical protein VV404_004612 [Salmonella enterica]|nr:hypothetical protein [Salmonella enterica]EMD7527401.1 hypothetical protein [Salmonella enterica]